MQYIHVAYGYHVCCFPFNLLLCIYTKASTPPCFRPLGRGSVGFPTGESAQGLGWQEKPLSRMSKRSVGGYGAPQGGTGQRSATLAALAASAPGGSLAARQQQQVRILLLFI